MERPQVRIVQDQSVESTREITGSEAEEILRKYGHGNQQMSNRQEDPITQPNKELTFEEMLSQQRQQEELERQKKHQQMYGPRPITFNSNQYDSEVKYGSDDELGFGFRIEITTDMKLPKH